MFTKCKKAHIFTKKINQNQLRYSFTIENEVFIKPDAYTLDTLGRLYTNGDFFTHQLGNKFMHCIKFIKKFFLGCLTNYMKMILDYVLHIDFTCFYKAIVVSARSWGKDVSIIFRLRTQFGPRARIAHIQI